MAIHSDDADVIVIGGGIAGLAAAVRLKDRGFEPLVLEAESRVGGRMTTDRVNGFVVDRGVPLFGNAFGSMRALVKRLGLSPLVCKGKFSVGIQDAAGCRGYRSGRFEDLIFDRGISWRARLACIRFGYDLLRHHRALVHGCSTLSVLWNLLVRGQWNLTDGVDRIPEAAAAQVRVVTGARVLQVEQSGESVQVETQVDGKARRFTARRIIFAIPGQLVPALCPQLPQDTRELLARTPYSRIVNAAVALSKPPNVPYAGYAFTSDVVPGAEIEMEHLRAPNRCPEGAGMAGVFLWDTPQLRRLDSDDESLKLQASDVVEQNFPECRGKVLFVHLVRWNIGIAQFPPGRLREMTALRKQLATWTSPFELCGDYLDGLSSEGTLRTGEEAAARTAAKLAL